MIPRINIAPDRDIRDARALDGRQLKACIKEAACVRWPSERWGPTRKGIQYEEYVEDAKIGFSVISDYDFKAQEWAMLWLTAEQQGLGASRSQGFGRFDVTRWDKAS